MQQPQTTCEVFLVAPREGYALVSCGHARFCETTLDAHKQESIHSGATFFTPAFSTAVFSVAPCVRPCFVIHMRYTLVGYCSFRANK